MGKNSVEVGFGKVGETLTAVQEDWQGCQRAVEGYFR